MQIHTGQSCMTVGEKQPRHGCTVLGSSVCSRQRPTRLLLCAVTHLPWPCLHHDSVYHRCTILGSSMYSTQGHRCPELCTVMHVAPALIVSLTLSVCSMPERASLRKPQQRQGIS